ncbi:MAG TPA: hypothetical protein VEG84_11480, partial [Thermoanaerobaculia bacterium]|nr:hypothetical protein [Thermoanaerobaculia bacterium]
KQHVLAFAVVGDTQGDYKGVGGDGFFQWPVGDVGNVTAEVDYMNFNARPFIYTIGGEPTTLPAQRTIYTNLGFLFFDAHLQPFARYERLDYAPINEVEVNRAKEQQRIGGGLNYYVLGQNFKITPYYERVMPKVQPGTAQIKDFNRFLTQIQTSF